MFVAMLTVEILGAVGPAGVEREKRSSPGDDFVWTLAALDPRGAVGGPEVAHSGGIHRPASGIATSRSPKGKTWSPQ
jgi:hypothetical protein